MTLSCSCEMFCGLNPPPKKGHKNAATGSCKITSNHQDICKTTLTNHSGDLRIGQSSKVITSDRTSPHLFTDSSRKKVVKLFTKTSQRKKVYEKYMKNGVYILQWYYLYRNHAACKCLDGQHMEMMPSLHY